MNDILYFCHYNLGVHVLKGTHTFIKRTRYDLTVGLGIITRCFLVRLSPLSIWREVVSLNFIRLAGETERRSMRGEKNKNNPCWTPSWIQAMRWMRRILLETSVVAIAVQGDSRQDSKLAARCCWTFERIFTGQSSAALLKPLSRSLLSHVGVSEDCFGRDNWIETCQAKLDG